MKNKGRLILFVGLLLLVTSSGFLSACDLLGGESASETDSRITKLESQLKTSDENIAKLQQQVQEQQRKIDALASSAVGAAPPPATTTPATPPPAPVVALRRVTYGKLTVTPAEVKLGEEVTVSIEVTNPGDVEGTYKVTFVEKPVLQITSSNLIEYAESITLKPQETKTVTFTTSKTVLGTYTVEVGGKVGQYTVIDTSTTS